jgi:magnesium-protoporphyrin O-methyltransferase
MSCTTHCCGSESIFDAKKAQQHLKTYRKKGPDKFTTKLIESLSKYNLDNLSLLDIGGGIGVLQHELIKKGINKTTDVDASPEYIAVAKELMQENGNNEKMEFIYSDYNDCHHEVDNHDIVTLSRVVCCYPDVESLINNSIGKANKYYGLVYPTDHFITKVVIKLMNIIFYLKRNPFRTFVHSVDKMNAIITSHGFERVYLDNAMHWKIALYQRVT